MILISGLLLQVLSTSKLPHDTEGWFSIPFCQVHRPELWKEYQVLAIEMAMSHHFSRKHSTSDTFTGTTQTSQQIDF